MTIAWHRPLVEELADDELLDLARGGERDAYGELFARYSGSARNYARSLLGNDADADDAVAEVFATVLQAVENGRGPHDTFAAYLFASVRHECGRIGQRNVQRSVGGVPVDASSDGDDQSALVTEAAVMRTAFASLPAQMRQILLLTEIDQLLREVRSPSRLNADLGTVAVRAMRARRALGSAYLDQHRAGIAERNALGAACRATRDSLVGYVRGTVGARQQRRVDHHLRVCVDCRTEHAELERINGHLRVAGGPTLLMWIRAVLESVRSTFSGAVAAAPVSAATIVAAASMAVAVPPPSAVEPTAPHVRGASMVHLPASFDATPEASPMVVAVTAGVAPGTGPTTGPAAATSGSPADGQPFTSDPVADRLPPPADGAVVLPSAVRSVTSPDDDRSARLVAPSLPGATVSAAPLPSTGLGSGVDGTAGAADDVAAGGAEGAGRTTRDQTDGGGDAQGNGGSQDDSGSLAGSDVTHQGSSTGGQAKASGNGGQNAQGGARQSGGDGGQVSNGQGSGALANGTAARGQGNDNANGAQGTGNGSGSEQGARGGQANGTGGHVEAGIGNALGRGGSNGPVEGGSGGPPDAGGDPDGDDLDGPDDAAQPGTRRGHHEPIPVAAGPSLPIIVPAVASPVDAPVVDPAPDAATT